MMKKYDFWFEWLHYLHIYIDICLPVFETEADNLINFQDDDYDDGEEVDSNQDYSDDVNSPCCEEHAHGKIDVDIE